MEGLVAVPVCGLCRDFTLMAGVYTVVTVTMYGLCRDLTGGRQGEGVILYITQLAVLCTRVKDWHVCNKLPRTMCTVCGRNVVYIHKFLKLSATMHIHVNCLGSGLFHSLHNTGSVVQLCNVVMTRSLHKLCTGTVMA